MPDNPLPTEGPEVIVEGSDTTVYITDDTFDDYEWLRRSRTWTAIPETELPDSIPMPTISSLVDYLNSLNLSGRYIFNSTTTMPRITFVDRTGASASAQARRLETILRYIQSEGGKSATLRAIFADMQARNVTLQIEILRDADYDALPGAGNERALTRYTGQTSGLNGGPAASNSTARMYIRQTTVQAGDVAFQNILAHETLHFALKSNGQPYSESEIRDDLEVPEAGKLFAKPYSSPTASVDSAIINGTTYAEVIYGSEGNNVINSAQGADSDFILTGSGDDFITFGGTQDTIAVTGFGNKILKRVPVDPNTGSGLVLDLRDVLGDIDVSVGGIEGITVGAYGTDIDDSAIVTAAHFDENWNAVLDSWIVIKHEGVTLPGGVVIVGTAENPRYYDFSVLRYGTGGGGEFERSAGKDRGDKLGTRAIVPISDDWIKSYEANRQKLLAESSSNKPKISSDTASRTMVSRHSNSITGQDLVTAGRNLLATLPAKRNKTASEETIRA